MLAIDESLSVLSDDGECWDEAEESSNSLKKGTMKHALSILSSMAIKVACED